MAARLIDANDECNPKYYIRRVGYPLPDWQFYEGRTDRKYPRQKVSYSQEKFVHGFDLTCGEFYRLREWLVPPLIEGQLYKQDLGKHDVK
jgi:hypothetical protein